MFSVAEAKVKPSEILSAAEKLLDQTNTPEKSIPTSDLHKVIYYYDQHEYDRLREIMQNGNINEKVVKIYQRALDLSAADYKRVADATQYLKKCADNFAPYLQYHCARIFSIKGYSELADSSTTETWAQRAVTAAASIERSHPDYWTAQYFSLETLSAALATSKNLQQYLEILELFTDAANKIGQVVPITPQICHLAYMSSELYDSKLALQVLSIIDPLIDIETQDPRFVSSTDIELYYLFSARFNLQSSQLNEAHSALEKLEPIVSVPQIEIAFLPMYALTNFQTKNAEKGQLLLDKATSHYPPSNTSSYMKYFLLAQIEKQKSLGEFRDVSKSYEKLLNYNDLRLEKQKSSERTNTIKKLEEGSERFRRLKQKTDYELQLSNEQIKRSRLTTYALLFGALLVTIFAIYYYRMNNRLRFLNADLHNSNESLEKTNTELQSAHSELVHANKLANAGLRAKEKFIGVVGHELRTPLNPIINMARILADKARNQSEKESLEAIYDGGQRLHMTIENMIAVSNETHLIYRENTDLVSMVCNIMDDRKKQLINKKVVAQKSGADFSFKISKSKDFPSKFSTGKIMLDRVLINIIDNAIKFTETGLIHIHLSMDPNRRARIEIRDTGPGISDEALKLIFNPFSQENEGLSRSHEGSGLGLTVSQKYLKALNGEIKIDSEIGIGTTVTVLISETFNEVDNTEDQIEDEGDIEFLKSA